MEPKLIMTLLVRDEEDILEENICFHLNQGVDFIVAADNNSRDNTPKILDKYAKRGVLAFRYIKDNTYEQSKWVSSLASEAVKKHSATHLFHCDADEFWYSTSGNLKTHLPKKNEVYYVPVVNYLPEKITIPLFGKRLIVSNPFEYESNSGLDKSYRMFLYQYPRKVMTTSEFTSIAQGNHAVLDKKTQKRVYVKHINIHHFPIRSYYQFKRKVLNGGSSYEKNPSKQSNVGWHWKEWYIFYKAGLLKDVYNNICLSRSERKLLSYKKTIKYINIPKKITYAKYIYQLKKYYEKKQI